MTGTDILAFVVSTGILDEYRSKDTCLDRLINVVSASPEIWQIHPDITITSPPPLPASHYERIYRTRLMLIPDEPSTKSLKVATARLIDYCATHPEASIWGVTFNCSKYSYGVFCGQINDRLDALCVMMGKHVPEYDSG